MVALLARPGSQRAHGGAGNPRARTGGRDVRVVIVHGHRDRGRPRISSECRRRVRRAERVDAEIVIFSGAGVRGLPSEAEQMADAYRGQAHVVLEEEARDTADNAAFGALLASRYRATSVVLVTSYWHVPRLWLHWRGRQPACSFAPAWGSLRYVPRELAALVRAAQADKTKGKIRW